MKNNRRNSTESTPELGPQQVEVIKAIMQGATVSDATQRANVNRTTFYLWLKSDAAFQAELNRAKQEQRSSIRAQMRGLADTALSTIRGMLTSPEVPCGVRLRAALAVLQSMGALGQEEVGETDPAAIERENLFDLPGLLP